MGRIHVDKRGARREVSPRKLRGRAIALSTALADDGPMGERAQRGYEQDAEAALRAQGGLLQERIASAATVVIVLALVVLLFFPSWLVAG